MQSLTSDVTSNMTSDMTSELQSLIAAETGEMDEREASAMALEQSAEDESSDEDELLAEIIVCTERLSGRQRKISATIHIPYSIEQVWQILTDYDRLAEFIPSLASSQRIDHPKGGVRIEQVGTQAFLKLKFCARVVLDMVEQFPNQIGFEMVEGDFKKFSGSWQLQPVSVATGNVTELSYTVTVLPALAMPVSLIERKLKQNLAVNLTAVRERAIELFE